MDNTFNIINNYHVHEAWVAQWAEKQNDDIIKWKHFPRYLPFVRGIHRHRWIPLTKASVAKLWYFFDLSLE